MARSATDQATPDDLALPAGARIACVRSTYHADLVDRMRDSALRTLGAAGLAADDWIEIQAPGAYELPILAQRLAERADISAVLCFGLVLRGETDHDRYISASVADALQRVGLAHRKPVLFGVLTPNNLEQARARALTAEEGGQDKGHEVAKACLEVLAALELAEGGA